MNNMNNIKHKTNILMTKKQLYTTPEVDVLVLQTEGVVCQSSTETGSIGIDDWTEGMDFII